MEDEAAPEIERGITLLEQELNDLRRAGYIKINDMAIYPDCTLAEAPSLTISQESGPLAFLTLYRSKNGRDGFWAGDLSSDESRSASEKKLLRRAISHALREIYPVTFKDSAGSKQEAPKSIVR